MCPSSTKSRSSGISSVRRIFQSSSESLPSLLSVITLVGRRFVTHLHPAGAVPSPIRSVPVECVFDCQGTGERFCPSSGRSRERAKIKPLEKFLKNFFTGSSFEHSSLEYRKTKKAQLPQWVTGPQPSVYGINGNKLRQKDSSSASTMSSRTVYS